MTPRPYLSWSQYNLFGRSPEQYKRVYFENEHFQNKHMAFGKEIALMREFKGEEHFEGFENITMFLPDYPKREYEMTATVIIDGKPVTLLGKFDGVDLRKSIIGDDKTGLHWNQKKADESEQMTFYAFIYWKRKKVIPKLRIHWIETRVENGSDVVATGKVETFETTRTVKDFIVLQSKINKRWRGIKELTKKEWERVV